MPSPTKTQAQTPTKTPTKIRTKTQTSARNAPASVETLPVQPESAAAPAPQEIPLREPFHLEDDSVESFISDKRIGQRIKALRQKKSMGLVDLGLHTGLSASFLSQLETGRVVPTLRNLARIAMVFSKDLSYFFEAEPQSIFRVHRAKDRLRLPQSGVDHPMYFFESLGYQVPDRQLDPYLAEFFPTDGREPRAHQHFGCEFLYVIKGQLNVRHGETLQVLEPGDAAYFDSSTVHSYICAGDTPATALIVTLQQPLSGAAQLTPGRRDPQRAGSSLSLLSRAPSVAGLRAAGQRYKQ
jgi:transcriptional regulator with XRE-family HTH domain